MSKTTLRTVVPNHQYTRFLYPSYYPIPTVFCHNQWNTGRCWLQTPAICYQIKTVRVKFIYYTCHLKLC